MRAPATLRRRVALASAVLGLVLCGLFVGAVLIVTEEYEGALARAILQGQADDYALRAANGLPTALPQTQRLAGYRTGAPAWLAALPPGLYEDLRYDGQHVGVFDTRVGRLYFVVDLADIEYLETRLHAWMAAFVAIGVAVSAGLGWMLAGRALQPLQHLADAVARLPVTPARTRLARGLPADELGRLATAMDEYQARLADSEERQQAFFADASHALRTPIAVVRGAAEVILDDPPEGGPHLQRVDRLDRGVRELGDLTEALLAVARTRPLQAAPIDPVAVVRHALEALRIDGWSIDAQDAQAPVTVAAEFAVLVRMLLRAMAAAEPVGTVAIAPRVLRFTPASPNVDAATVASPLIRRLAERIGARVVPQGATVVLEIGMID